MQEEYENQLREAGLRRGRLRRLLRKLPQRANLHRYPVIKWFAEHARTRPYLWSFKRAQVMPALYVGSVVSLLPFYGIQLFVAFAAALLFRANLTIMVALQFITNPLTIVPIYAFTAWVGVQLMQFAGLGTELSKALYYAHALSIGGIVVGLAFALTADLAWRFLAWESWRFNERLRKLRAQAKRDDSH